MKNKKGFTLIELLAVIVLLGIIMVIAVPAITSSSKKTKERMLKTKVELAEQSLMLWAQNNKTCLTGESLNSSECLSFTNCSHNGDVYTCDTTMGDMAAHGLIKYDDESTEDIINPVDKSSIKDETFIINYDVVKKKVTISGQLISELSPDVTRATRTTSTSTTKADVVPINDTTPPTCGSKNENTVWTNKAVDVSVMCVDSGSGCEQTEYRRPRVSNAKTTSITIADVAGNTTDCTLSVMSDLQPPTNVTLTIEDGDTLKGTGKDTLSGIKYYYFGTESNLTNISSKGTAITPTTSSYTVRKNSASPGTYYFYVQDQVGNITISDPVTIQEIIVIDNTPPSITISPDGLAYYRKSVSNVKITATDNESSVKSIKYIISTSSTATPTTAITSGSSVTVNPSSTNKYYVVVTACNAYDYCKTVASKPFYIKTNLATVDPYKAHIQRNGTDYVYKSSSGEKYKNGSVTTDSAFASNNIPTWNGMTANELYYNYQILDGYATCYTQPSFEPDVSPYSAVSAYVYTSGASAWMRPYNSSSVEGMYPGIINWYLTDDGCYIPGEAFKVSSGSGLYTLSTKSTEKCYALRNTSSKVIVSSLNGRYDYYYPGTSTSFFYNYDFNCLVHGNRLE